MKVNGIGDCKSINEYVSNKIKRLETKEKTFQTLLEVMFSERDNIMYESSAGYRIEKKTYGEVYHESLCLAAALKEKTAGLPYNAVVGIYLENSIAWIELFWATLLCGYRPLLMNLRLENAVLEQVLRENNAALVISAGKQFAPQTLLLSDLTPAAGELADFNCGTEVLVMSSGTSQHIKICAYTAEEFFYQICGTLDIIRKCPKLKTHYNGDLKLLTFLPFYHVFGLIAVYIWFAFFSRTFVQLNDMSPQTILNTIKRHKVTHIFAVPLFWETVYSRAMDTIKARGEATYKKYCKGAKLSEALHDVPLLGEGFAKAAFKEVRGNLFGESVQFLISGGSNISRETLAFFNNIGYRLANGYGMTEIGITSVELSGKKRYLYDACVGEPLRFIEYKTAEGGELLVRGKATAHYIIDDGVKKDNDGWYATGDIAACKDGHWQILSRRDDIVISSSGENINPFLIESAFTKLQGISEACLIKAKADNGVKPVLLLRLENSVDRDTAAAVAQSVLKTVNETQFPHDGRVVYTKEPLMKPDDFKLNRKRLSQEFASGALALLNINKLQANEEISDELLSELRSVVANLLNRDEAGINVDDDLFLQLGVSSLEYFSVLSAVNERYSVNLLQGEDGGCRTVRQIWTQVKEQNGGSVSHC